MIWSRYGLSNIDVVVLYADIRLFSQYKLVSEHPLPSERHTEPALLLDVNTLRNICDVRMRKSSAKRTESKMLCRTFLLNTLRTVAFDLNIVSASAPHKSTESVSDLYSNNFAARKRFLLFNCLNFKFNLQTDMIFSGQG